MSPLPKNSPLLPVAESVGSFIEYWGFKKVHGKIWTLIFLSPDPVDANYLKDSLGISKALTSMSMKDLLHYEVVLEVEKERPGTQKYRINPDITNVILGVIKNRELKMLGQVQKDFQSLNEKKSQIPSNQMDSQRLKQLGEMVDGAQSLLAGMIAGSTTDFSLFEETTHLSE